MKTKKPKNSAATPVLDTAPSKVNVNVLNGTGISGLAGQAGSDLAGRGFNVVSTGDAAHHRLHRSRHRVRVRC